MKVMGADLPGGTSFMEDYIDDCIRTDTWSPRRCTLLEICASMLRGPPPYFLQVRTRWASAGRKIRSRLVFDAPLGRALNASSIDLGNRFRLVVNVVDVVKAPQPLPKLPGAPGHVQVAVSAGFSKTACGAPGFAQVASITTGFQPVYCHGGARLEGFSPDLAGIEFVLIDARTVLADFEKELRWNEVYYHLAPGLRG